MSFNDLWRREEKVQSNKYIVVRFQMQILLYEHNDPSVSYHLDNHCRKTKALLHFYIALLPLDLITPISCTL